MKTEACKGCGKPIVWAKDEKGMLHPLDYRAPVYSYNGTEADGTVRCHRAEGCYVSHFATCPKANDFSPLEEEGRAHPAMTEPHPYLTLRDRLAAALLREFSSAPAETFENTRESRRHGFRIKADALLKFFGGEAAPAPAEQRVSDRRVAKMLSVADAIASHNDNGARLVDALLDLRDAREAAAAAVRDRDRLREALRCLVEFYDGEFGADVTDSICPVARRALAEPSAVPPAPCLCPGLEINANCPLHGADAAAPAAETK